MKATLSITVTDSTGGDATNPALLQQAVGAALRRHGVRSADLNLTLVSDREIARLNRQYLGHDGPTDVLTFDLKEVVSTQSHDPPPLNMEGEIVLSTETAERQARQRGHSVDCELALYAVHGVLHLLGFRDDNAREADRMHEEEDLVLRSVGLGPVFSSAVTRG